MLMCPVYACKSPAINAQLPRGGRPCLFFDLLLQLNCSALSLRHVSVRPRNIWTSSSNIPSGNLMLLAPGNGPLLHVFQLIVSRQCINERHFPPFKLHTAFLRTGEVSSTTWRAGSNLETTSPPPRRRAPFAPSHLATVQSAQGTNAGEGRDALRPACLLCFTPSKQTSHD